MLLDASEFHADSLAPAFTFRKVYPAYRLQKKKTLTRPASLEMASKVRLPEKFLWRTRKELHGKKENLLIDLAINDLIHRPQVIGKLGSLSYSGGHAE